MRRTAALLSLVLLLLSGGPLAAQQVDLESTVEALQEKVAGWDADRLQDHAEAYKGALEEALQARKEAADNLAEAADDEARGAAQAVVDEGEARIEALADRLQVLVNALRELDVEVTAYQMLLTSATGEIKLENVSAEMAVGLVQQWIDQARHWLVENGPGLVFQAVVFVLILVVFWLLAGIVGRLANRALGASRLKVSALLRAFTVGLVRKLTILVGLMIAVSSVGVNIGPLLAGVGVVGFIVGFALQETLSNFAAGVMILLYRPFDVGDFVQAGSVTGAVESMSLVNTTLVTPDNRAVIVPNGSIWGADITNYTAKPTRRVDLTVGISYSDDIDKAQDLLEEIVKAHPKVLADPAPVIKVANLGDSSVDIVVRPWCATADYWNVFWDLTKAIKQKFDEFGVSIPFPQRDIHIHQAASLAAAGKAERAAASAD